MTGGSAIGAVRIRACHNLLSYLRPGWSRLTPRCLGWMAVTGRIGSIKMIMNSPTDNAPPTSTGWRQHIQPQPGRRGSHQGLPLRTIGARRCQRQRPIVGPKASDPSVITM